MPVTLVTGASSQSKTFSLITAEISAPIPEKGKPSSQVTTRLVFLTEFNIVSVSKGRNVIKVITSPSIPISYKISAA